MSRQAKKALTQVASFQNPAAIHAQRKSILLNKAGSAVAGASAAGLTGVKAPYLSSLADVSKSLTKEKPKEQAEKKAPQAAPPVTAPEAPIEKPKQVKDVPKDETKEAAKEEPSAQEPKGASAKEGEEKGQTPEKGAKSKKPSAKEEASPKSPDQDPAFQSVVKSAKKVSKQQGKHEPTGAKVSQAKAAAKGPPNEVESQAKDAQIKKMDGQEPGRFDKAVFKAALLAKITSITPENLEQADDFKKNKKASSIKNDVTSEVKQHKEGAQGSIEKATTQPPDPSAAKEKEQTDLAPVEAGPAPPDIGGQLAAPKPKTDSEVSLEEGSQNLDRQMEEAEVTEEQLTNSNEPQFQEALSSKKSAQQHAKDAPVAYRQDEQGLIAVGQEQGAGLAQQQLQEMHQSREAKFNAVQANQTTAVSADEQKRQEVATNIEKMYTTTKEKVEARLKKLDEDVNRVFDSGIEQATKDFEDYVGRRMSAYKDERYDGVTGKAAWVYDKVAGMPDEVNVFYVEGKDLYLSKMDVVIDEVATLVETGLNEAKDMIAAGRQEIKTYVEGLDKGLQDIGKQAAADIDARFDELSQTLDEKNNQLIDSLSKKYVDNLNKVDERINQMKAENKGLVDKALDAVVGVIKTILKLKDMLLGVLAKVASVVTKIIKNPIGFVGNLVKGVKKGLDNFVGKIGDYLKQGLFEWLFGALAGAGIQVPESLDFKGVLSLVMQVLGLTYAAIRARAVKILGEGVVKGLEQASEIFTTLVSEGPAGLWKYMQEKIADLKDTVIEGIKSFLIEKVIMAGVTWIIGLLNPASAFIKAAKAIYDIVMFFVTRGSQIMSLVDALIDSMGAIADGGIGVAAGAVEKALGKAVPVVIGFLASLLGLGGVSEKISGIIKKVQAPVNKAVDWVINQALKLAKAAGKFMVGGTKGSKKEDTSDPEHDAKVSAGLAALHQLETTYLKGGKLSRKDAMTVATRTRREHPVFKSITVLASGETWDYDYVASPGKIEKGRTKEEGSEEDWIISLESIAEKQTASPSRVKHRPASKQIKEAAVDDKIAPIEFEKEVAEDVAESFGAPTPNPRSKDRWPAKTKTSTGLPAKTTVLAQPKTNLGGGWDSEDVSKRPDFVVLSPENEPQIEVIEVTLDANFRIPEGGKEATVGAPSHKRVQIASTVFGIANKYPGVPIVYTVRATKRPSEEAIKHIKQELAQLKKGGINVEFLWVWG